ncbi:hypothetical protein [Streptomyces decoyicus]|uniref:hypothetical protein n=1 Tax=Streptomyces decoyicus TaxID=249567 RepID=UPI00386F0336
MPIPTLWKIDHACGHTLPRDLSDRPADRRAGFARWLSGRYCTECWKASRDDSRVADTQAWLEGKRKEEQEAADTWARQYEMPPLEGPAKALGWGSRCRHQLVTAAYRSLVAEGVMEETGWSEIEEQARTITRAGWWIDQRDCDSADLPELLAAATDTDRPTENPYL